MVALIAGLRITANSRNFKTSMTRLNGMREPTKRRSRYTAMIASRVLPMAIPDVVFLGLAVWMFYRSATDSADQGRGPGDLIWDLIERFGHKEAA